MTNTKFVTGYEAACAIPDGATVAVGGFCGFGSPDEVLQGMRERFERTGSPQNITLFKGVSVGDKGERGVSRIALEGLVGKVICAHVGLEPPLARMNRAWLMEYSTVTRSIFSRPATSWRAFKSSSTALRS